LGIVKWGTPKLIRKYIFVGFGGPWTAPAPINHYFDPMAAHTLPRQEEIRTSTATTAATLLSSDHGRMRRAQRLIEKRDLQAALMRGVRELSLNPRGYVNWKYTFADVVFITDERCTREITCWAIPGAGLDVEKRTISEAMQSAHRIAISRIAVSSASWTSHTAIIVDQSGSMRKTDVEGGATRSDAVWLTLALDVVAKQIESGQSTDTDVVSVLAMCSKSVLLIDRQPHDWLLFNRIIDLLRKQEPHFDGKYLPALDAAESLLVANTSGSCALALFFLSDGKPSDHVPRGVGIGMGMDALSQMMGSRIEALASRFGRRLSVVTVGFAGPDEDFRVLGTLALRPAEFGSIGRFHAARLDAASLGIAFSSLTSSLNATRTEPELTSLDGALRPVRDVRREKRDAVDDTLVNGNWHVYWYPDPANWRRDRIIAGTDRRQLGRRRVIWSVEKRDWISTPPLDNAACGVALRKEFFGDGAERLVRKFREVAANGCFVGPRLVANFERGPLPSGRRQHKAP
jgi:hypothetical protein